MKVTFSFIFFFILVVSSFSVGANLAEKRAEQLCYLKNKYIRGNQYTYRVTSPLVPPFFSAKPSNDIIHSIFLLRKIIITKPPPFKLQGISINIPPFGKDGTITHWLTFNGKSKKLSTVCKQRKGVCLFKVVYKGNIKPEGYTGSGADSLIRFNYENELRVFIYDGHNNILKFPANCPNSIFY